MITRDNAASISGTAQNARQRLGELIQHYMDERSMSDHRVSRTCSATPHEVEAWRTGKLVPTPEQWGKLKRSVHHAFGRFAEIYQRARAEEDAEARERAAKNMEKEQQKVQKTNPAHKIATSLGDKLAGAGIPHVSDARTVNPGQPVAYHNAPVVPISIVRTPDAQPVAPGNNAQVSTRKPRTPAPVGSYGAAAIAKRAEFVRNILRTRPEARTTGRDSIVELVRSTFGVGISPEAIEQLRAEVAAECRSPNTHTEHKPIVPIVEVKTPIDAPPNRAQLDHEQATTAPSHGPADISSAVQLILEALPHLQAFTITVDESGEAHVDYQIRKVTITTEGGSLKVRR